MKHFLTFITCSWLVLSLQGNEYEKFTKPLLEKHCYQCHGKEKTKGKVNLYELGSRENFLGKPALIKEVIEVLDAYDMPPEEELQPSEAERTKLIAQLKEYLRESAKSSSATAKSVKMRRLNRFQYNNAVKDLFRIKKDLFPLTEKLMTRHTPYLKHPDKPMPGKVDVESRALATLDGGGFKEVVPFPKDLRAAHGFDNQANQLTLSPLLLDAFLKLSVSILESPDFHEKTVGIWKEFFAEPQADADLSAELRKRLEPFLEKAFRAPVDEATLDRYSDYAKAKIEQGLSYTDTMKKVSSAVLSSPLFLFRYSAKEEAIPADWTLASNLSFFLWNSIPDEKLLELAKARKLSDPKVLDEQVTRMLRDPKIEGFLDIFPAQWMQLENVLSVNPDPKIYKLFKLDPNRPAGVQMVLEPLLLFDAVFQEERPIVELLSPNFSYQSQFLQDWYTSDLKYPVADTKKIEEDNRKLEEKKQALEKKLQATREQLDALTKPIREKILADREILDGKTEVVDLEPYAGWEFDGDLYSTPDTNPPLNLKAHGKIDYQDGKVVLNKSYLESPKLPIEIKAKTLEVWCELPDINQRAGGVMTMQGPGGLFDSIVYAERKPKHWISGSNNHSRTKDFPESTPETKVLQPLHLVITYAEDGTTTMYRNGQPYGKPYRKGSTSFPKDRTSVVFGLRHLPPGGNKHMNVILDKARFYDRELTAEEVEASYSGSSHYVTKPQLVDAMKPEQKETYEALTQTLSDTSSEIAGLSKPKDPKKFQKEARVKFENEFRAKLRGRSFERVKLSDPRYGGILTNSAMLSMTSGPKRTHPIARGAWVIEVIFNDPPPPPPNDVPPLKDDPAFKKMTIREQFAQHREHPDCAGCHQKLDPLGFALENFDITGRWREKYKNGREVDASGKLLKKYAYSDIVEFKESLSKEERRFAKAFTAHLLRYAVSRELTPTDSLVVESIVEKTTGKGYPVKALIREIVRSEPFLRQ